MPRTAYAKSTDTRAQLIAAALEEASERGLRAASVAGIAARANAAVGSLGYHFGSRNALLREAIEQLVSDLYARQAVADAQAGPGFFERHRAELLAYVQYVRVNPSHIRLTDEIKYVEPELYRSGVDRWVELLRMRLRDGIAEGVLRPMDDEELTAVAHFLLGGRHFLEELVDQVGRDEVVVDAYLDLIRRGLGA